ncbi:MAG: hypothetical protein ABIJ40_12825 [Bacteroidota bacterium]
MIKDFYEFREAIGMRESSNNYQAVNRFGFCGRFQFGKPRLWDLGYSLDGYKPHWYNFRDKKPLTKFEFLNNKELQDLIFFQHVQDCIKQIKNKGLDKHICTYVNKVKVTMSGLVAGMHLGGLGSLTKWLVGIPFRDGFGTSIQEYIEKFSDYDLENY